MTQEEMIQKIKDRIAYHSNNQRYGYFLGKGVIDNFAEDVIKDLQISELTARAEAAEARLKEAVRDFYQYAQGGTEICAYCLHDNECEPGETICGATYKGFKWRGLNERDAYRTKIVTNADRIRSMTDEELAQFLGDEPPYFATYKQYIDWLRKPIESEVEESEVEK